MLVPDRPKNLYRSKTQEEREKGSKGRWRRLMAGVSFAPSTKGNTINKALRREVLAYTTDGIAQSVDRAAKLSETKGLTRLMEDFARARFPSRFLPANIDEPHGHTIQRFGIYIQHNASLLYRDNNKNIVSDSQLISIRSCFGSHKDDRVHELNPPSVHAFRRVKTNLVLGHGALDELKEAALDEEMSAIRQIGKQRQFVDFAPLLFRYIRIKLLDMSDEEYKRSIIPQTEQQQKDVLDAKC